MSERLSPCPHCGSRDVEVRKSITDAYVACCDCGCRTGMAILGASDADNAYRIKEAVAVWNRLPDHP